VVRLAESLGYFKAEGLDVVRTDLLKVSPEDYLMQAPLIGRYRPRPTTGSTMLFSGHRHNLPVKPSWSSTSAPGMTIMVATV